MTQAVRWMEASTILRLGRFRGMLSGIKNPIRIEHHCNMAYKATNTTDGGYNSLMPSSPVV